MKDFNFRNDTLLFFRNDIRETIMEITKGHKVMLVYGGSSIKRNGCYDDLYTSTHCRRRGICGIWRFVKRA